MANSCFNILDCFFSKYISTETHETTLNEVIDLENMLEALFVYALTWSTGITGDRNSRQKFSEWLVVKMDELNNPFPFPVGENCFNMKFDMEDKCWVDWMDQEKPYTHNPRFKYDEIIVPTKDLIK